MTVRIPPTLALVALVFIGSLVAQLLIRAFDGGNQAHLVAGVVIGSLATSVANLMRDAKP